VKAIIEAWRRDYNESRPHSALLDFAPEEFVRPGKDFEAEPLGFAGQP